MNRLNFKMSELIHSDTAVAKNINNMPTIQALDNMQELIIFCLQPIRELINKPVIITSGYRCPLLNKAVGGASNSHHMLGTCADIKIKGMTAKEVYDFIKLGYFRYRQLILEKNSWVHIEYKKDDLKQENLIYNGKTYMKD